MAFTKEEADYYHDIGLMPDWAWVQQNGRSPQWNYDYQHRKIIEAEQQREAAKRREEAKKKIEQQILDAMVLTMQQGEELVANAAADDIIASINSAFGGSGGAAAPSGGKKSFSAELGAMLGKALGEAPFKLLDDIFKDEDEHRSRR